MRDTRTYSQKLKDPRWHAKRLEILQRDNFTCRYCETEEHLQVHHIRYGPEPWEIENEYLITLCDCCHKDVEFLKKTASLVLEHLQILNHSGVLRKWIKNGAWDFENTCNHRHITDNFRKSLYKALSR